MKPSDVPVQAEETATRRIDDLFYVMNAETSELHNFNEVGSRIWELIDGRRTVAEIAAAVCDEYEVERAEAERDVSAFIDELCARQIATV